MPVSRLVSGEPAFLDLLYGAASFGAVGNTSPDLLAVHQHHPSLSLSESNDFSTVSDSAADYENETLKRLNGAMAMDTRGDTSSAGSNTNSNNNNNNNNILRKPQHSTEGKGYITKPKSLVLKPLIGYQLFVNIDWLLQRSHSYKTFMIYTGDPSHVVYVQFVNFHLPSPPVNTPLNAAFPDIIKKTFAQFELDNLSAKYTDIGTVLIRPHLDNSNNGNQLKPSPLSSTSISSNNGADNNSNLKTPGTIASRPTHSPNANILIPDGNYEAKIVNLIVNINLRRFNCGERTVISFREPTVAIRDRFAQLTGIRVDNTATFIDTIINLGKMIQFSLILLNLLQDNCKDGLICDETTRALYEFHRDFGPFPNVDIGVGNMCDFPLIKVLLETVSSLSEKLSSMGFSSRISPKIKEPSVLVPYQKQIKNFQLSQGLPSTSYFDMQTINKINEFYRKEFHSGGTVAALGTKVSNFKNKIEDLTGIQNMLHRNKTSSDSSDDEDIVGVIGDLNGNNNMGLSSLQKRLQNNSERNSVSNNAFSTPGSSLRSSIKAKTDFIFNKGNKSIIDSDVSNRESLNQDPNVIRNSNVDSLNLTNNNNSSSSTNSTSVSSNVGLGGNGTKMEDRDIGYYFSQWLRTGRTVDKVVRSRREKNGNYNNGNSNNTTLQGYIYNAVSGIGNGGSNTEQNDPNNIFQRSRNPSLSVPNSNLPQFDSNNNPITSSLSTPQIVKGYSAAILDSALFVNNIASEQ